MTKMLQKDISLKTADERQQIKKEFIDLLIKESGVQFEDVKRYMKLIDIRKTLLLDELMSAYVHSIGFDTCEYISYIRISTTDLNKTTNAILRYKPINLEMTYINLFDDQMDEPFRKILEANKILFVLQVCPKSTFMDT